MRRACGLAVMLWLLSVCLWAQDQAPKVEVFGGYSLAGIGIETFNNVVFPPNYTEHIISNGWNAAVTVNVNKTLGIVADFGGYYGTHREPPFVPMTCSPCITIPGALDSNRIHTFMFGPQASIRFQRFTPFAHGLFGAAHAYRRSVLVVPPIASFTQTSTDFSFAVGGGLDANISHRLAFRIQGDYLRAGLLHFAENNLRVSTGLVLRFGN